MLNFPKTFKDTKDRSWTIDIPFSAYLRLKNSDLQLNLEDLIFVPKTREEIGKATQPLVDLVEDREKFFLVVYEILRLEAEKINVTFLDFADSINGNTLMKMVDAFCQGLYDFFPERHQKRLILEDAATKGKAMVETMETRAKAEIPRTTQMMVQAANREIDNQLRKFASDLPASPESIPSP